MTPIPPQPGPGFGARPPHMAKVAQCDLEISVSHGFYRGAPVVILEILGPTGAAEYVLDHETAAQVGANLETIAGVVRSGIVPASPGDIHWPNNGKG